MATSIEGRHGLYGRGLSSREVGRRLRLVHLRPKRGQLSEVGVVRSEAPVTVRPVDALVSVVQAPQAQRISPIRASSTVISPETPGDAYPASIQDLFSAPKEASFLAKAALWYFKPRFPETTKKVLEFMQVDKFLSLATKYTLWLNKGQLPDNYTMKPSLSGMIRTAMVASPFNEILHTGAVLAIAAVLPFVLSAPPVIAIGLGVPLIARQLLDLYCILGQRYTRAKLVSPINRALAAGKPFDLKIIAGR